MCQSKYISPQVPSQGTKPKAMRVINDCVEGDCTMSTNQFFDFTRPRSFSFTGSRVIPSTRSFLLQRLRIKELCNLLNPFTRMPHIINNRPHGIAQLDLIAK